MSGSLFYYTARSSEGAFLRGSIEAPNDASALANLRTRALFVTSLERSTSASAVVSASLQIGPVRRGALVAFFRCFATLLSAGVSIRRALEVTIADTRDARLAEALRAVLSDIESGLPLSAAMERRPREFTPLYAAMIRAGETGGVLDGVLERLASVLERDHMLSKRVWSTLAYPTVVALTAAALVFFLLTSIVPMFAGLYDQMHVALPRSTILLIRIGRAVHRPGLWVTIAGLCTAAAIGAARLRATDGGARAIDDLRLRMPLIGSIVRKAILARLARMLGTLLRSGVGLVAALDVMAGVVGSRTYQDHIAAAGEALGRGETLASVFSQSKLYDPILLQLVRAGEETGSLDVMLLRVATYYETDVETALDALASTLEPVTIVFLGGIVCMVVAAVYVPLYSLIGSIK